MAISITKRGNRFLVTVRVPGQKSKSATKDTKLQANAWGVEAELAMIAKKNGDIPPGLTVGDLLVKYRDEVSINKRGCAWETTRLNAVIKDDPLAKVLLTNVADTDVVNWRNRRLKVVKPTTVQREWNLLSSACTFARSSECKWLKSNPFSEVKRPAEGESRIRRVSPEEVEQLLIATGTNPAVPPCTVFERVGFALLFAIETAMRAGEIVGLEWSDIVNNTAKLWLTKNNKRAGRKLTLEELRAYKRKNNPDRVVPLSTEARRLLSLLDPEKCDKACDISDEDRAFVFRLKSAQLDAMFRKARARTNIEDLHFHDSRREALTRLSAKVDVMTLAKISGHRDLKVLLATYYAPNMEDVVSLLD